MNLNLPLLPIYIADAVGSTLSIVVAIGCLVYSWKLTRRNKTNAILIYLFWVSIAFATFTIFRSSGHLIKYILLLTGNKDLWATLSSFSGGAITLTFIFVATLTFYYERVKKSYQYLQSERDQLQNAKTEIGKLNQSLRNEVKQVTESEWRLDEANKQVSALIDQVRSGGDLSVRYDNPDLINCWEVKDCIHEACPAYNNKHLRCWHFGHVYCCNIKKKMTADGCRCDTCEIYLSSQRDPLSRLGERFNDMMHILQTKHEELQHLNIKLKEMDKQKSKFLDIVAHDLRTPLTSILSYADLLLRYKDESDETREEFLQTIVFESRRLGDLINDYLDLSKIEAGLTEFFLESMDFREVIDHAIAVYKGACMQKQITIKTEGLPDNLPIIGDKRRLTQVISNVLSNATKFTPDQGTIKIRGGFVKEGAELHLNVCDSGPGIPKNSLEEIFKKFTQVQDGDMHTIGGTGIGLSICKEIIMFHDGRIWAENNNGGGACFHLTIPSMGPSCSKDNLEIRKKIEKN